MLTFALLLLCAAPTPGRATFDLAVTEFASGSDPGRAWQGRALAALVTCSLDRPPWAVAPYEKMLVAQRLAGPMPAGGRRRRSAAEMGRLARARLILAGRISSADDGLAVRCRLVRSSDARTVAETEITAPDVFGASQQVLEWLARWVPAADGAPLPTRSPEAIRKWCEAQAVAPAPQKQMLEARLAALEAAVAADRTFPHVLDDLGQTAARLGDDDRAMALFVELAHRPGWAGRAAIRKGQISEKLGRFSHAHKYYSTARGDPGLKRAAQYRMARLAQKQGDPGGAERLCDEILDDAPLDAEAANLLGVVHSQRRDETAAAQWYARAIAADPLWDTPHDNLAVVLEERGNLREAAEHLRRAIELNPANARCYRRLALVLAGAWRYKAGIGYARRALELRPDDPAYLQSLGAIYYHAGEPADAIRVLTDCIEIDGRHAPAHYTLGLVHAFNGDIGLAVASYRRALQIDPTLRECKRDLDRAELQQAAERRGAGRSFGCASTRNSPGDPAGLAVLLVLCLLPALWFRLRRMRAIA